MLKIVLRSFFLFLLAIAGLEGQFVPGQYIVEMKEETDAKPAERRARASARRLRVESALAARGFRTLARTEIVANVLVVQAPEDNLDLRAMLSGVSDVAQVHKVRIFHKTLDRAAQVHGVTQIWDKLGIDKAGAGVKIGILDSGIEARHPGFQDPDLPKLDGYPKVGNERDLPFTNNKIVVARSYSSLFSRRDPELTVVDRSGHGTAVAMAAAGSRHESPMGTITGMAPAAYLGIYKVFGTPGVNDGATDTAILQAIEDSVLDGMDVINLSFGSELASRPENDIIVRALARAEAAGVIAVVSAGNDGPGFATLGSPASAPTALTVGASENSRFFHSALVVQGGAPVLALVGSQTPARGSVDGTLVSAGTVDPTELVCAALPSGTLSGKIALILRGTCNFEVKINFAAAAGATAVVVYSDEARPTDFISMAVGTAQLPSVFIRYADGLKLKEQLRNSTGLPVLVDLALSPREADPNRLARFSSKGPISGVPVKPDLLAVGTNVYTAAQTVDPNGKVYSANGYVLIDGTSFSSPIAAGIVAILKSARPGLKPIDYRSLLVNSARPLGDDTQLTVLQTGAGLVDLSRALIAPLRINPVSVSFIRNEHLVEVSNLNRTASQYQISVEPKQGRAPQLTTNQLDLAAGGTDSFALNFDLGSLEPGVYSGTVIVWGPDGVALRMPYWYGKAAASSANEIQTLVQRASATSGTVQRDLLIFRVLDVNGISIEEKPVVRMISGGGTVQEVQNRDFDVAGSFGVELVLGLGQNVIEVEAQNGIKQRYLVTGR